MAWYRAGTVAVANGNAVVTGTGTDFVSNATVGQAFLGPDGRVYEVAAIVSATQITLAVPYMGASAAGQGFAILPTQSFARDLALGAAQLLNSFAAVRDGIGQGLIGAGTVATPGIRFAVDQDTGVYTDAANTLSITTGGVRAATFWGGTGVGLDTGLGLFWTGNGQERLIPSDGQAGWVWQTSGSITIRDLAGNPKWLFSAAGSVLTAPNGSAILRSGNDLGLQIGAFGFGLGNVATFYSQSGANPSFASATMGINASSTTGRSINAGGTVNASGADYAEYMTKAPGCGTIAPGTVCGVDASGHLTDKWGDALAFVVKSTDPAYVGGDTWAAHLPRPVIGKDEKEADFEARVTAWEAQMEAARQTVDRIAFSGQVPVMVAGTFGAGDYLVAAQDGAGIKAVAIHDADVTFDQYRRRLGRVWAVRDGHAWVDVQHG